MSQVSKDDLVKVGILHRHADGVFGGGEICGSCELVQVAARALEESDGSRLVGVYPT